ncbi:ssDNA endonuclease and repair protein rad10 [Malassezia sp. CBS 17886]|nr:ssDNA endonuclease and repair protein rad10 [Malassezia sp. CBS 17886]
MSDTSVRDAKGPGAPRAHPLIRGAHASSSSILVNSCQVHHIRGVAWEYADIVPDYQVGLSNCVLYLSIRYHRVHPEYIHTRIQRLANMYNLRMLLVLCDVNDHQQAIKELTKVALVNRLVLIVCWSYVVWMRPAHTRAEEAAGYLETYKSLEQKPPDAIRARPGDTYLEQLTSTLTKVSGVNKTDTMTLAMRLGSLQQIADTPASELIRLPGMGDLKAHKLARALRQPFREGGPLEAATDTTYNEAGSARSGAPTARFEGARAADGAVPPRDETTASPGQSSAAPHGESSTLRAHDAAEAPPAQTASTAAQASPSTASAPAVLDALPDNFAALSEEEQLAFAMQLSVDGLQGFGDREGGDAE